MAYKGNFKPSNRKKYLGNINRVVFRSLWERRFMIYCDNNSQVLTKNNKGKKIIKSLFNLISKKPYKFLAKRKFTKKEKFRVIADFISGMTDRYAINLYNSAK